MANKNEITPSIDYNELLLRAVAVIKQARALLAKQVATEGTDR